MRFIHVYIYSIYINNANWVLNSAATKGRKAASSWPTTRCHIHTHRRSYIICTYTYTHHTQLHCSGLCENNKQSAAQKGISTSIHAHRHTQRDLFARQCSMCTALARSLSLHSRIKLREQDTDKITPVSDVTFKQRCSRCVVNANVVVAVACVVIVHVFYFMLFFSFIFGDSVQVESAYRIVSSVCIFACHCVCASMCVCVCTYVCAYVCTGACLYVSMRCGCVVAVTTAAATCLVCCLRVGKRRKR